MNFTTNWRDRRTIFTPPHYSIANYSTETKNGMKNSFREDLFLNNLHLIPDPLLKNLADTMITEEKMAPKSKSENNIDVKTNETMHIQADYSPLSGITSFFSGVMNVISNAMFSKRKQADFVAETAAQMAVPPMWQSAKITDENKILPDENCSHDMSSELLASEMTDCRRTVAHCQNKLEQVRLLLGSSKPVPCNFRARRRPKKVFVEAGSVKEEFEDAFSPEDFENIANDSFTEYSSPVCYHNHVFHEIDGPKVKIETLKPTETEPEVPLICESTEIVKNVPEIDTASENKLHCDTKQELVASCEDKLNRLKALLQERRKKPKTIVEPGLLPVQEPQEPQKVRTSTKVKDKKFKNPNRCTGKRTKSKMKKNIQDDLHFANEIHSDDLSSVENSPSVCYLEKHIKNLTEPEKEYFNEVSGCFHPASVTESEDSFQIVFNDSPKLRRMSDCDSEDSFIIFEDSPDSCYTSNDVFGESTDSEEYDSDSDLSDSGCDNMSFNLAGSLSKSVCNLADDSLYNDPCEDEVDCANVQDVAVCDNVSVADLQPGDLKTGLLIDDRKKLLRKDQPAKKVHFSEQPPKVHVMRVWSFAARQARAGHWQRYAIDRDRFKRRIADVDVAVSWVLKPQHRSRVMFQRFMPWWNAQKRKELAEKKERDAQEKLRREEEALRTEAERLKSEEETKEQVEVSVDKDVKANNIETDKSGGESQEINGESQEINGESQEINGESQVMNGELVDNVNEIDSLKGRIEKLDVTDNFNINESGKKSCNNEIIPLNDKILVLNTDFVANNALDT